MFSVQRGTNTIKESLRTSLRISIFGDFVIRVQITTTIIVRLWLRRHVRTHNDEIIWIMLFFYFGTLIPSIVAIGANPLITASVTGEL